MARENAQHTPGRLIARNWTGHAATSIGAEMGGRFVQVAECGEVGGHFEPAVEVANARRIVACWNACEGIPTEMLKAHAANRAIAKTEAA